MILINIDDINLDRLDPDPQALTMTNLSTNSPDLNELVAPPGLKGLVVADTSIGSVRGAEGFFHYREHDAVEVARHQTFEGAAHLLIDGHLPTAAEESSFRSELATARAVDPRVFAALETFVGPHLSPMAGLRAGLALLIDDRATLDLSPVERRTIALGAAGACLLYTSPSPRDATLSRMPSSA